MAVLRLRWWISKLRFRAPDDCDNRVATTNRSSGYGHEEPAVQDRKPYTRMSSRLIGDATDSLAKKHFYTRALGLDFGATR